MGVETPHALRHKLDSVSNRSLTSPGGGIVRRSSSFFAVSLSLFPTCRLWLCYFSVCRIVLGPQRGAAEGIVLSSWGYCPGLMYACLFMLLSLFCRDTGQFSKDKTSSFPQSFTSDPLLLLCQSPTPTLTEP